MKLLLTLFCLLVVSHFAQAGNALTSEQEVAYKQGLARPVVTTIREYIDDCFADESDIGYPCRLTADSEDGLSIQEQGIDKLRGRFMVLRFAPFDSKGDVSVRGDLVTVIFDTPPHWLFTVTVVYQGEDKLPVIWGFHPVEMTSEKHQGCGNLFGLSGVMLSDPNFGESQLLCKKHRLTIFLKSDSPRLFTAMHGLQKKTQFHTVFDHH